MSIGVISLYVTVTTASSFLANGRIPGGHYVIGKGRLRIICNMTVCGVD
jgi:hypothetical protein